MTTNPTTNTELIGQRIQPNAPVEAGPATKLPHYFVLAVLVFALPFVYLPQLQMRLVPGVPPSTTTDQIYVADLDFWRRTERETQVAANAYFDLAHDLNNVPLDVGQWHGVDVEENNQEVMILLEPEQYIQRLYQRESGEYIWLSMIGGRSSQPFHAPDICYDADGWQYNLGSYPIALDEEHSLFGLWLEANKTTENGETLEHVVFYFYLFPNETRKLSDGIVLFKLTSGRHGTVEETLALHADFIRNLFFSAPTLPTQPS